MVNISNSASARLLLQRCAAAFATDRRFLFSPPAFFRPVASLSLGVRTRARFKPN